MSNGVSASAGKLIPANPSAAMVIRDITPNVTTLSVPFLRFGRLRIGGRGTIVRLQSGALAVFSPVALTPEVQKRVQEYGNNVKYISALDFEHHIFLGPWAKAFPDAKIIGVEGLPEKRELDPATKGLKFDKVFTKANQTTLRIGGEFDEEFDYEYVPAHDNKELVYFHRPTGTVIEADLLFNLPATEQYSKVPEEAALLHKGFLQRLFVSIQTTAGPAIWQKRFLWYLVAGKDRKGMSESVVRMDKWDIKRIVPCHGDVIDTNAKVTWDKMFEWFKVGKK